MGQHQIGAGEIRDCALEQRIADDAVVGIFLYELLEVLFFPAKWYPVAECLLGRS